MGFSLPGEYGHSRQQEFGIALLASTSNPSATLIRLQHWVGGTPKPWVASCLVVAPQKETPSLTYVIIKMFNMDVSKGASTIQ